MSSTRHEKVYHAAHRCQAASLSLAASGLCSLKWACRVENQKTAGFFVRLDRRSLDHRFLGSSARMMVLCRLKGCRLIAFVLKPHRVDDAYPDISQRAYRHTMTLALNSFAFVIQQCPRFLFGGLPGKLMQRVAQRLQAGIALMGFGIIATLEGHGRGSCQSLHTRTSAVPCTITAPFSQQTRSKTLSRSRKAAEKLAVFMSQKKGRNLLVIGRDLLNQRQELSNQCHHQSRFRAGCNRIGMQLGLLQRDRIVGFETGRKLIDDTGLTLHQAILIAGQCFEFLDDWTIRSQFPQIWQITSPCFGQQVCINGICFGSRSGTTAIDGFGVHRVNRTSCFQHRRNEKPLARFDDACNLVEWRDRLQEGDQFSQSFRCMGNATRGHLAAGLSNHHDIVMRVSPVHSGIPHGGAPFSNEGYPGPLCPYTSVRRPHDPLMVNLVQEHAREARSFLIGRAVRRKKSFPGRPNTASIILLRSSLKGPSISLMYKGKSSVNLRLFVKI